MTTGTASAQRRIATLAQSPAVHRAFHWLHLHQPQLRQWLLELVQIPAPTFSEHHRAEAMLQLFTTLGLSHPHLDDAGNALALLPSANPQPDSPVILLSAHLDTVFPADTVCTPTEDGNRILAPGACDNTAGLSALLGFAAALRFARLTPETTILFAANTGEEGEGDLRGMRHLLTRGAFARRIRACLVLEGAGTSTVVTRALGSLRFRLTATGPGGHSWTDSAAPNPIFLLARTLVSLEQIPLPSDPRTTLSVGLIGGGTSVNSVPASASAQLDLRSTDAFTLHNLAEAVHTTTQATLAAALDPASTYSAPTLTLERIGDRPAAALPGTSPLLSTIHAVDRHLGLRTEHRTGSTDANLPLSLNLPAVALGTGGTGGGIHTLAEWYDPTGRELALRRILLTLLDTATLAAEA